MDRFQAILSDVWREVCQHIEIAEAVDRIANLLSARLPIRNLVVRQFDLNRGAIETVAHAAGSQPADWAPRSECKPEQMTELLTWCRRNVVLRSAAAKLPSFLRPGLRTPQRGDVMVGPLSAAEGPIGFAVFLAERGVHFESIHETLVQRLLEPLSVAMLNDARVREIATLREAAEADKRSLLTRMGRQDISDTIVGADNGLRHVMERVQLVAPSDAPVLLFGETGSGKEVVARAVHNRSPRASAPFLRVNCGAIPPDLIDSELFGHEKGSFTGASNLRKGWFERADGGTLFLDEIGELPPAAQVRILRILQDGTFERVGGQQQLRVNVRIVAATHRNLQAMVAEGRFREDLWYRVAVFPLYLPSLRDRPEDIPELAAHFAMKSARRFGLTPTMPTPDDMHLLISYAWPGNVRELAAVIDRAAILGNGKALEIAKALGANEAPDFRAVVPPVGAERTPSSDSGSPFLTLDEAMKQHIQRALSKTHGRIEGRAGAAELLAINPYTLRARMRKLGIDWAGFRRSDAARG